MFAVIITIIIVLILIALLIIRANRLNLNKKPLSIAENDALNEDYLSHGTRKNIEDLKRI